MMSVVLRIRINFTYLHQKWEPKEEFFTLPALPLAESGQPLAIGRTINPSSFAFVEDQLSRSVSFSSSI